MVVKEVVQDYVMSVAPEIASIRVTVLAEMLVVEVAPVLVDKNERNLI